MKTITVKEILNVKLVNENLLFSDGFSRPATIIEQGYFENNRQPKGVSLSDGTHDIIRFFDYHRHSEYSLLDGSIRINDMVKNTKYIGAVTDHGNMYGVLKWYTGMKKDGKIPVIGEEFYCEDIDGNKNLHHLILLAKNSVGYKNLCKLSSLAFQNIHYKPHISYEMLKQYSEGLVCTSACIGGEISQLILNKDDALSDADIEERLDKSIKFFKSVFKDDYYLEIQNHHIEDEKIVNPKLIELSKKYNIKLVAATDSHYETINDEEIHEVILCIGTKKKMSDSDRMKFEGDGYHLYSQDDIEERFRDIPEAIDNTLEIMEKCQYVEIITGVNYLPDFPIPDGFSDDLSYLKDIAKKGFTERFSDKFKINKNDSVSVAEQKTSELKKYWERWKYEMSVIEKMGFAGYFLVVWDFLKFCRDNNIPIGPGRGSGAGSLILYCLHITDFDPIEYDLLFERFLNPDRISLPDIDSDISKLQRDKVLQYVNDKYGEDHVAHIITFGTMAAKNAIKDVARVYEVPPSEALAITKTIPNTPGITIKEALAVSPEFSKLISTNNLYKKVVDIAKKVEGLPRQTGMHACGIIISREPVDTYCPLARVKDRESGEYFVTTQFEGPESENVGLVKFDFLGLRTLDVLDITLSLIKKNNPDFSMLPEQIPTNDIKSYLHLRDGNTDGVFQFESDGMTSLVKEMFEDVKDTDLSETKGKECFERLIAAVALYRPGPMDEIPHYLEAMKSGNIKYDHPKLENILSSTYGILVYQEEIMLAVRELAGFSKGDSDSVRKAMGKKKLEIMNEYGEYFIYGSEKYDKENPNKAKNIVGCINNGISEETARIIWEKMVKFASYAFNKSHATCYAALGVRTAYLSCHYPVEFMTGMLNSYIGDNDKISFYIRNCRRKNITVLPPDINLSNEVFDIITDGNDKKIIFGLSGIKGVGPVAAKAIVNERDKNGKYRNIEDFLVRTASTGVNKRVIEALIYTGAFDSFKQGNRKELSYAIPDMLKLVKEENKRSKMQLSLFNDSNADNFNLYSLNIEKGIQDFSPVITAFNEKEYLGYFVNHPMTAFSHKLDSWRNKGFLMDIAALTDEAENSSGRLYQKRIAGLVQDKKIISYKDKYGKNKQLLTFTLNDETGSVKCVGFDETVAKYGHLIDERSIVYILCNSKSDNFGVSCEIQLIHIFSENEKNETKDLS